MSNSDNEEIIVTNLMPATGEDKTEAVQKRKRLCANGKFIKQVPYKGGWWSL